MADQFYGVTDTGKERKNNEDTFIAQATADGKFIIACVIDGVGGYSGGEVAARLAREAILQRLTKPTGEFIPIMIDCFNQANQKILDEKKQVKEHDSMACVATLTLIDIEHNQFYYAHVGDTRLYLLRDNSLVKISHDQSFVGFLEESGRVNEAEAMAHPKRNEINKALGFEANLVKDSEYIETGQSPFLPGDMLLLCSDGLSDMVTSADITTIITHSSSSLKDKGTQLIDAANAKGGKDNITVVLAKNDKQALKHNATMPAASEKKKDQPIVIDPVKASTPITHQENQEPTPQKSNGWIVTLLVLLTLVFLAGNVWQYLQNKQTTMVVAEAVPPADSKPLGELEIKLQNAINNLKGNVLLLADTAYAAPINISRAIQVKRDTLFIKTKGKIELVADSVYKGTAFSLNGQCKLIMLDSLSVKNFKTGVIAYNNALLLKNVRFNNCVVAVQNLFTIAGNKFVSGDLHTFRADSIPMTNKQN
ncbi:PP2C family protein-serine/threonine phosphatase [Mucilaginibacter sp. UYCu711]|uniref:PP2C family protein-serine/threonine phosphatase n=1 Tax=Mucilaginibacter sp. UYCu711 TaxID=3156339 RepID=UPI003D24D095